MIRLARVEDAEGVHNIYAPLVRETAISLEWEAPSVETLAERIKRTLPRYPWLVYEENGRVLGYAYASPHRSRISYQWSTEVSVYVHEHAQRRGIGGRLYRCLFDLLRLQGYVHAFAIIGASNPESMLFHEQIGFKNIAHLPAAGYKAGAWHDVVWMRKELAPLPDAPSSPVAFAALEKETVQQVLQSR